MPIYKYKSFEQTERALWNFQPDAAYYKKVVALWAFANRLRPIKYPRGIFKFRTIEEANRHRDEFESEFAKELQRRRSGENSR